MISRQITRSVGAVLARGSTVLRSLKARSLKPSRDRGLMGPPKVMWSTDDDVQAVTMACPNCGSGVSKPLLLRIEFTTSPGSRKETTVLKCPSCTCLFYAAQIPPNYAEDAMLERGRVPFYLQQGAGLSLITRPLAQVRATKGSTYVEVGCGFGFGLDYALHAKGWTGMGIDPGAIAVLGQEMLGVSIDRRYLGDQEPNLAATCNIVMASETIEHVVSPKGFVSVLRSLLLPGGTVTLTTPDGADLRPETPPSVLIGLLSPGLHLIFQSQESLRRLLVDAGFGHVIIQKDGHSLVAFASDKPLDLESDSVALRTEYRSYLRRRASDFPPGHDLNLAFAGRAFQEAVNDAAFDEARDMREALERSCRARFGRCLDDVGKQMVEYQGASVEDLAERMPLSLGGILHADAILRMASGTPRSSLAKSFTVAAAAADLLRAALADLALADGLSEEIAWTSRAEALLCAAAMGESDVVAQLSALPAAPDAEHGAMRRDVIAERVLVELVNAGHYEIASKIVDAARFDFKAWADADVTTSRSTSQRDALFCLAVLDSQQETPSLIQRSRARFIRIQQIVKNTQKPSEHDDLFSAARRGELAALERLGHNDPAVYLHELSSHPVDG